MHQTDSDELYSDLSVRGFEALFEPGTDLGSTNSSAGALDDINTTHDFGPLEGTDIAHDFSPLDDSNPNTPYEYGDDTRGWTLRAASEKLGLSPNTIRKRIRLGQLQADKIIGLNGPEWRIQPPGTTTVAGTGSNLTTVDTLLKLIETQARQLEIATSQLTAATEHVKAATRVIAYQQIQLEEKQSKVKLLTDSHHHKWWPMKILRRLMKP